MPGRKAVDLSSSQLFCLGVGGWFGNDPFQDRSFQLENPGRIERMDELGLGNGDGDFDAVTIGISMNV